MTTYNRLIEIQNEQLAAWANVLEAEIHAKLVSAVKGKTYSADELGVHPDTDLKIDRVSNCIPRGGAIDEIVHNWAMNPKTIP